MIVKPICPICFGLGFGFGKKIRAAYFESDQKNDFWLTDADILVRNEFIRNENFTRCSLKKT